MTQYSVTTVMNEPEHKFFVKTNLYFYEVKEVLVSVVSRTWTGVEPASQKDIGIILTHIIENDEYKEQKYGGLQKSAKEVRRDRNIFTHDRPEPKLSSKEHTDFKRNMLNLLKNNTLQNTGKAGQAVKRIEEIFRANYVISLEDELKTKFSALEGHAPRLGSVEKEIHTLGEKLKEFEEQKANQNDVDGMYEALEQQIDEKLNIFQTGQENMEEKIDDQRLLQEEIKNQVDHLSTTVHDLGTSTKRRRETDGLTQLMSQTENILLTSREQSYILTKQTGIARKLLDMNGYVVVKGNTGEGKTVTAHQLIDDDKYKDRRVVLYYPDQCKFVDTDCINVVILEDIFGQSDFKRNRLTEWMRYLDTIQAHVHQGKLSVIITSRTDVLSKAYLMIESCKLFSSDSSLTLSSEQLEESEKRAILNRELIKHERNMTKNDIEKCIANFSGLIGFPKCCSLFAENSKLFGEGPEFFGSPKKFFISKIALLEKSQFLFLAFLFCLHEIPLEYLSEETMPKIYRDILQDLVLHLAIKKRNASITLLRNNGNNLMKLYVKSTSCNVIESGDKKSCIQFSHPTVAEAVGIVLGFYCPEMIVKYGDPEYLYKKTSIECMDDFVHIPEAVHGQLARRMVCDILDKGLLNIVLKHSACKQSIFYRRLKEELCKDGRIELFKSTITKVDDSVDKSTMNIICKLLLDGLDVGHTKDL